MDPQRALAKQQGSMPLRDGGSAYRRFSEPTRNCSPEGSSHRQNELQTKSHAAEGRDKKKAKTMAGIAKHKIPMLLKDEAGLTLLSGWRSTGFEVPNPHAAEG